MATVRLVLRAAAALTLLALAAFFLRLAWAHHLYSSGDPEKARRAAQLHPWHPVYQAAAGNLERAVALNPYYGEAWIGLAERAEAEGKFAEAERLLLRAASVDQTFPPRWALANFYFRRDREADFWNWLRLSAERSYGDRNALFQLAWRQRGAGSKLLAALPADAAVLEAYVSWLLDTGRLEEVGAAAERLVSLGTASPKPLEACEKLLQSGRAKDALGLWANLVRRGMAPAGQPPTNAKLESKPLNLGFDWRLLWRHGIASRWSPGQVAIELEGNQMEQTDLLSQAVAVTPDAQYRFTWNSRTEELSQGLLWRVTSAAGEVLAEKPVAPHPDWQAQSLEWKAPSGGPVNWLVLWYSRVPGTVRQSGTVYLNGGFALARLDADAH